MLLFLCVLAGAAAQVYVAGVPQDFMTIPWAWKPIGFESLFPAIDVVGVTPQRRRNRGERVAGRQPENHLGSSRGFGSNLAAPRASLEFPTFLDRQCQRHIARQYNTTYSVYTVH